MNPTRWLKALGEHWADRRRRRQYRRARCAVHGCVEGQMSGRCLICHAEGPQLIPPKLPR